MHRKKRNETQLWQLALGKSRARGVPVGYPLEGPAAIKVGIDLAMVWFYPQIWLALLILSSGYGLVLVLADLAHHQYVGLIHDPDALPQRHLHHSLGRSLDAI